MLPGNQLRLGDPGHGGAMTRAICKRRVGLRGAERLHSLEDADRLEVEVGQGAVVVVHAGEAEGRARNAPSLSTVDTGQLGDLGRV